MTCRFCGMDTKTVDKCEWCKRVLQAGGAPAPAQPRIALTGDVYDAAGAAPLAGPPLDATQPVAAPTPNYQSPLDSTQPVRQPLDATQPVLPPIGATQLVPPPVGAPPNVYAGPPPATPPRSYLGRSGVLPAAAIDPSLARTMATGGHSTSIGERWEKFLAISLPILLLSVLTINMAPNSFIWVALADFFLVGLAMGASAAIASYDDAYLDCGVVLIVCYFFGPIIGLVVYLIVGAIKQEFNSAILFLLFGHVLIRLLLLVGFAASADSFTIMPQMMLMNIAGFLSVCASFAGWILSSFFRPLDE